MHDRTDKPGGSGVKWLVGCGVALLATAILCIGGGFLFGPMLAHRAVDYVTEKAANVAYGEVMGWFEQSGLPPAEVEEIGMHLDRLRRAIPAGNVDGEKLAGVLQELTEGPLLPMGVAFGFSSYGIAHEDLDEEERDEMRRDVRRFQKGLWEGEIDPRDGLRIFEDARSARHSNQTDWKDVNQVRRTAAEIRRLADDANIQDTDFDFDISDEIGRRVSEVLGD